MMEVTVIYGHPTSPEAFEKYYAGTHLPLAGKMKGVARLALTKLVAGPDGEKPASNRTAEVYFASVGSVEG